MSDFDMKAFLRSVHRSPEKKQVGFDKEVFQKALNATLRQQMPFLSASGRSAFFVYPGNLEILKIARGMAVASARPTQIVQLASDDLLSGDAGTLLRPLLKGQLLIVVHSGTSTIAANLAEYWPQFCEEPRSYSAQVATELILNDRLKPDPAGAVIVLQTLQLDRRRNHLDQWWLRDDDASEFAALADQFGAPLIVVGRTPRAFEPLRDNQHAYRVYRKMINTIRDAGHDYLVAEGAVKNALHGMDPTELEPYFLHHKIETTIFDQLFDQLRALANYCRKLSGEFRKTCGGSREELPDVYAAALRICGYWEGSAVEYSVVFRGQRKMEWPVVPSFFRPNLDGSRPDLAAREERLTSFVHLMRTAYPQLDERQCIAAAQHVSAEAVTPTWLVDVSWDPLIALYFASSGSRSGDIGVVDQIVMSEWEKYIASDPDYSGGVVLSEVPNIERIRRQRGLFLNAPRADLYERYVPYRMWFRQHDGLVFTDALRDSPITDEWLLPREAGLDEIIASLGRPGVKSKPLARPPADPTEPLRAEHLWNTLRRREDVRGLDHYHRTVLEVICQLFVRSQEWVSDSDITKFSFHRLEEVILRLAQAQQDGARCDFESALELTKSRLSHEEFGNLLNLGHRQWMQHYRIPPAVALDEIARFLDDIGGMVPTLGGVTIPGPHDHIDAIVRACASDSRWRFHDLRSGSEQHALGILPDLVAAGAVVIAAAPDLSPRPLASLAQALADGKSEVRVAGKQFRVSPNTLIVVIFGAGIPFREVEAASKIALSCDIDEFRPR